jgi:hypothetical protein
VEIKVRKNLKTVGATFLEAKERVIRVTLVKDAKGWVIRRRNMKIKVRENIKTVGATFLEAKERVIRVIFSEGC